MNSKLDTTQINNFLILAELDLKKARKYLDEILQESEAGSLGSSSQDTTGRKVEGVGTSEKRTKIFS